MDEYDDTTLPAQTHDPASASGPDSITLFLSLYLLVLAFFILLVTISTTENIKTRAVMDSLTSTFTTLLPTNELTSYTGQTGDVVAAQQFQDELAGLFASAIAVARVQVVQPGKEMYVTFPADSLFKHDSTEIRPAQTALLDRLVGALSQRPAGLRYDLEFLIGSDYAGGRSLPVGQTQPMARAGVFAREMMARGAPSEGIAIGLKGGQAGDVVVWFKVRADDEAGPDAGIPPASVAPAGQGARP